MKLWLRVITPCAIRGFLPLVVTPGVVEHVERSIDII
jgi:hypothetical protein